MKTIAIVRVYWFNDYCEDYNIISSDPKLLEGVEWREVSDYEYIEIVNFLKEEKNKLNSGPSYIIIEKLKPTNFDADFAAWKEKNKEKQKKEKAKQEKAQQKESERLAKEKEKEINRAKKILEKHNIKVDTFSSDRKDQ